MKPGSDLTPILAPSRRLRRTPFSAGVERAGVRAYTVYNHMLLPAMFESLEADYHHLKHHVQVWDVSCQRQVELSGPDAGVLLQMLTPRDTTRFQEGGCYYIPVVDNTGGMLNDPVALKLAYNHYWISIADSDLLLWVNGLACAHRLHVRVEEPDVSPLAVQGPWAEELVARVFGDGVRSVRFFRFGLFEFAGRPLRIARSGYSRQGGFEIYVEGADIAMALWDALMAAGADLEVRAGGPNLIERIEGGLLSYGNDMTRENTPFECGLGKFCASAMPESVIGRDALSRAAAEGPEQQIRCFALDGERVADCTAPWPLTDRGERIGQITSAAWSPDLECNVAIGMLRHTHWGADTGMRVQCPDGERAASVR